MRSVYSHFIRRFRSPWQNKFCVLRYLWKLHESNCTGVSVLLKLQHIPEISSKVFPSEFSTFFRKSFFTEHLWMDASGKNFATKSFFSYTWAQLGIREKGENNNQTFSCTQYLQDPKWSFDRVALGIATYKIMCKYGIIGYCRQVATRHVL